MAVAKYFEGKNVFITGGSGFVGKALIEKLLRSCPKLGKIYVLMRSKKGRSIEERLGNILSDPLFDVIRKQNPDVFKKLIVVNGDICKLNLGLSDADREMLVENVNIIYHSAASIRFDDFLKDAIIMNVRGTREVTKLALDLKNISIFVHVSTAYCNSDKLTVDEKLYPAYISWRDAIRLVEENEDEQTMVVLTEKIIRPLLNTYTFTKLLGEHVVNDLCNGKIPATIVRPSIVVNSFEEPMSGWIDNFNGPFGMLSATGKGVARILYIKADGKPDYIPVDCLVKIMILATYKDHSKNTVEVYNVCTNELTDVTGARLSQFGMNSSYNRPFQLLLWYPRVSLTACFYSYFVQVLMFHMLPAIFVDIALRLARKKPMLFRLQRKIFIANTILFHFMSTTFNFRNDKIILLQKKLKEEDSDFGFDYILDLDDQTIQTFFDNSVVGIGRYLFKENMNLPEEESRRNLMKYWYADVVLKTLLFGTFIWIVFFKMNVIHVYYSAMKMFFSTEDVRSF